jgi:hypothetical protein
MSYEHSLEKKVKGALIGFKNGTKTVAEVNAAIKNLREANDALATDFNNEFVQIVRDKNKDTKK